jgi:DNA excision repair protein ERCC-5
MPTVSTEDKPDARLATEAELKQFIDEVHPEDIDIESPEFRALPTEVQYEIVGDMRARSRITSTKRLADMLRAAPSAIDFSMAQIKNLSQRNALTQQLYTVTDSVGSAHLKIPVRIAAERNREYVLVKRDEAQGGGWALGIREGSKQKPIQVEDDKPAREEVYSDTDSDYSDGDIQEVAPPPQPSRQTTDPDLREHRRREVLEAIAARYAPKKAPRASLDIEPKSFGKARLPGAMPLFESTEEDDEPEVVPSANDEALALALQQEELGSDEEEADLDLARALAISRKEADVRAMSVESIQSATSEDSFEEVSLAPSAVPTPQNLSAQPTPIEIDIADEDEDEDMEEVTAPLAPSMSPPSRLDNPVIPAQPTHNQSSQPSQVTQNNQVASPAAAPKPINVDEPHHVVSSPSDLQEVDQKLEAAFANSRSIQTQVPKHIQSSSTAEKPIVVEDEEDDFMEIVPSPAKPAVASSSTKRDQRQQSVAGPNRLRQDTSEGIPKNMRAGGSAPSPRPILPERTSKDEDIASARPPLPRSLSRLSQRPSPALSRASSARSISRTPAPEPEDPDNLSNSLLGIRATRPVDRHSYMEMAEESVPSSHQGSAYEGENNDSNEEDEDKEEDEDDQIEWSKSPSLGPVSRPPLQTAQSGETIPSEVEDNDEDMAPAEMVAEQDDYARFMASIRNRDLNEVRGEIDDEIRVLNNQNKVAMRDSDEITQAMVAQIQVCHTSLAEGRKLIVDPTSTLWYTIHHCTHGGRSSMCQTRRTWPSRRYHHRRFRCLSIWRFTMFQKHLQRCQIRRMFPYFRYRTGTRIIKGTTHLPRLSAWE